MSLSAISHFTLAQNDSTGCFESFLMASISVNHADMLGYYV